MPRLLTRAGSDPLGPPKATEDLHHHFKPASLPPRAFLALGLAACLAVIAGTAFAQAIDSRLWVTNGSVNSVVRSGQTIYLGGLFDRIGPASGGGVPFNLSSGSAAASFPQVAGAVYAVASDAAGGWYIGGSFTSVGGQPRVNLAHVASDLSVTAWAPNPDTAVAAIAVSGSTVYVGGDFTSVGGQPRNHIAALDASGFATTWNPNADGPVASLAVDGATVYAGGDFRNIGGQPRQSLAALDGSGNATGWDPGASECVYAIVPSGPLVYVGGAFTKVNGVIRKRAAAIDASTGVPTDWNPNVNGLVTSLAVTGSAAYLGGGFTKVGGVPKRYLVAVDLATGALDAGYSPAPDGGVASLVTDGATLYAGGGFTSIGGQSRSRLAALDASGNATSWDPNPNNGVFAMAVSGSRIYAGGLFSGIGGVTRRNLAALDASSGQATAWDPGADNEVYTIAVDAGVVYVGGSFKQAGGAPRNGIAAINPATGAALAWDPNADSRVNAIAVSGSTVYAAGYFTNIGGQARNRIAALDAAGNATAWDPSSDGGVNAIAVSGSTVYAAGTFTNIGGAPRNRIAALGAATGAASGWNPNANKPVYSLSVGATTVYAGGLFTNIGGQTRSGVASLDAATGFATTWSANANAPVSALSASGSTVYAGGEFTTIGGQPRKGLAGLDATSGATTAWDPNRQGVRPSEDVAFPVYASGSFLAVGGRPTATVAAIAAAPEVLAIDPPQPGNTSSVSATVSGRYFVSGATVKITSAGHPDIPGTQVVVAGDGLSLAASFDMSDAVLGTFGVAVTNPDGQSGARSSAGQVQAVEAPLLRVDLVGPPAIRADHPSAFDLLIQNPGNVDARDVPLWISGIPATATVSFGFDLTAAPTEGGELDWSTVPLTLAGPGGHYLALLIPRVPPGTVVRRLYVSAPNDILSFDLRVAIAPPWEIPQESEEQQELQLNPTLGDCLVDGGVFSSQTCVQPGLTAINDYLATHPEIEAMSGIGVWAKIAWNCQGATSMPQALALSQATLDFMGRPIFPQGTVPPSCSEVLNPQWSEGLTVIVASSLDPNDKFGPSGMVAIQQQIPYTIRFENIGTAAAQGVTVKDTLPAELDLSTVRVGVMTFDSYVVAPATSSSSFTTRYDLRPGHNLMVDIHAALNPVNGVLTWTFTSIDPATGQLLDPGSLDGFLPPNNPAPRGEGSVLFTAVPKSTVGLSAQIDNRASIVFDTNPAILTPTWSNIVDNEAPQSNVLPLPGSADSASFTVRWQTTGAPPDLKDFTIYFSKDGGSYEVWKQNTTTTTAQFLPDNSDNLSHTYAFYSVARDEQGNIEPAPGGPDAATSWLTGVEPGVTGPQFALEGARPNPAFGSIRVWFSLAGKGRATLEVLDIAGRRVVQREVGSLGAGRHSLSFGPAAGLRPGLYFLRLSAAGRSLTTRVVMIR